MTIIEFLDEFNVLYNNINSNQAPGLNEYQISVFMTKAQDELLKNLFVPTSTGNPIGLGMDMTERRNIDFSNITKVITPEAMQDSLYSTLDSGSITYQLPNDVLYILNEVFYKSNTDVTYLKDNANIINNIPNTLNTYLTEANNRKKTPLRNNTYRDIANNVVNVNVGEKYYYPRLGNALYLPNLEILPNNMYNTKGTGIFTLYGSRTNNIDYTDIANNYTHCNTVKSPVVPIHYSVYTAMIGGPYKSPARNQVWRLMSGGDSNSTIPTKTVELIIGAGYYPANVSFYIKAKEESSFNIEQASYGTGSYVVRYIRKPKPIILFPQNDSVSIDGVFGYDASVDVDTLVPCELDSILHKEIVQRAVELAKIAWSGEDVNKLTLDTTIGKRSE